MHRAVVRERVKRTYALVGHPFLDLSYSDAASPCEMLDGLIVWIRMTEVGLVPLAHQLHCLEWQASLVVGGNHLNVL